MWYKIFSAFISERIQRFEEIDFDRGFFFKPTKWNNNLEHRDKSTCLFLRERFWNIQAVAVEQQQIQEINLSSLKYLFSELPKSEHCHAVAA